MAGSGCGIAEFQAYGLIQRLPQSLTDDSGKLPDSFDPFQVRMRENPERNTQVRDGISQTAKLWIGIPQVVW